MNFFSGMNNWVKNYVDFNDYSEMTGIPTKMAMVLGSAAASYLALDYFGGGKCYSDAKMDGKTVVITGCNTGIGKETARDLSKRGAKIIMACRNLELAEKAAEEIRESTKGEIVVKKLDLANLASVRAFAKEVLFGKQGKTCAFYSLIVLRHGMGYLSNFGIYILTPPRSSLEFCEVPQSSS